METSATPRFNPRIGFHYFPDTLHYRQIDLETWLPELQRLGASWLALVAPATRAIPESFIAGLLQAGIQPLLHFPFRCSPAAVSSAETLSYPADGCGPLADAIPGCGCPPLETLRLLLGSYARWGVKHAVFFDRPNCRASWPPSAWLQGDLVERFLDLFQPVASLALSEGLAPVLPPLAPGGDFWDLAFLRLALRGLQRRDAHLLDELALAAEAWVGERALDWGAGGPEKWPGSRPYHAVSAAEPPAQDHRGFHIYDWYLAACRQELGRALPLILLRMGQRDTGATAGSVAGTGTPGLALAAGINHARQNLAVAQMLSAPPAPQPVDGDGSVETAGAPEAPLADQPPALPEEVIAGCFWLLAAERGQPGETEAWFPPAGMVLPAAEALRQWVEYQREANGEPAAAPAAGVDDPAAAGDTAINDGGYSGGGSEAGIADPGADLPSPLTAAAEPAGAAQPKSASAIAHYVLLPVYAWGAASWDLTLIQPILDGGHPTIGFSLSEARLARRVTVVGGPGSVSTDALAMLRRSGCQVERLMEDGTLVAT